MKHASLGSAALIVVIANGLALVHAARNRSGQPQTDITLSDRELSYYPDAEDSGVALTVRWVDPGSLMYSPAITEQDLNANAWLNKQRLQELGFQCNVPPSDTNAYTFYARQSARTGFVAFEYAGDAWNRWMDLRRRMAEMEPHQLQQKSSYDYEFHYGSRLIAIDGATSAEALRGRHPDRNRVLILPAVFRVGISGPWTGPNARPHVPARLNGFIQEVPSVIHVSKPYSSRFRSGRFAIRDENRDVAVYSVHLLYGKFLEPWVVGVDFAAR